MARGRPKIRISADALELEDSRDWPVLITLRKAYSEACAVAANFAPDSPKSALLGALQSGTVRGKSAQLVRITRRENVDWFVERQFKDEYIFPEQWAKCVAFNPRENSMNSESGKPILNVCIYSDDLCRWIAKHGDPVEPPLSEFSDEELATSEMNERRCFEEAYLLSDGRLKLKKRGAPVEHDWAKAVAHVLLARLHQRRDGQRSYRQADWARSLQDALGNADGGPTDSTANQYAAVIMEELEHWRARGADFG